LFLKQIMSSLPVTVTHPEVRRYFLTTADAVTLLLLAASTDTAPGVLVPELGEPVPVVALARHLMANGHGSTTREVPVVFTQLRPGDKMSEALLSSRESYASEADSRHLLRSVKSPSLPAAVLKEILRELERACRERSLEQLLAAVAHAVPEYRPSTLLQKTLLVSHGTGKETA
jgi:FlaA1/EpsC-like NDP-sugar epimerase